MLASNLVLNDCDFLRFSKELFAMGVTHITFLIEICCLLLN